MTRLADHLGDDLLSAFVDDQVNPDERELVQTHLRTCSACQQRLEELRSVVDLLRALPDVPTPRDFKLGPRLVADPPNVVRLRRWYVATRVAAGSLAAVFVLLTAGVVYVDSRPSPRATSALSKPEVALAPASGQRNDSAPAPASAKAAAPAAAQQASPAAAFSAPAAQRAAPPGQPGDQVAATTSTSALPTLVPTRAPTAIPIPAAAVKAVSTDDAAPLRIAAIAVGILAVLALVTAVAVRRRLQRTILRF